MPDFMNMRLVGTELFQGDGQTKTDGRDEANCSPFAILPTRLENNLSVLFKEIIAVLG